MIDLSTEFGQRVVRRLKGEQIIWLTTVDHSAKPQPRPVWFLWHEETIWMYSQPNTHKLDHIRQNPQVALHFDSDGRGGDIIVFSGTASIESNGPSANEVREYIDKYALGLERIGMTPEAFADSYSIPVRVELTSLRGH